jgi:hypothetical protein
MKGGGSWLQSRSRRGKGGRPESGGRNENFQAVSAAVAPQLRYAQFNTDDYSHLAVLEGIEIHRGMDSLTLYSFIDGNPDFVSERMARGPTTWNADPSATIDFFRPLSSALMTLNHEIAGLNPLGYAIHSLLWYLLAIALLGLLVTRVFPKLGSGRPHPAAYLVMVMFALSASNRSTVMWNASRWVLISTALGLAGLIAHLKWREEGWKPGLFLSLLAISTSLLAGEASLAVLAFLAAYELFGNSEPLRKRLMTLLPVTLLVLAYLAYYKVMGHGSTGLAAYRNPLENPIAFISALPSKALAMLGELFLGVECSAWFFPGQRARTVVAGLAAIVLVGALLYPTWRTSPRRQRRRIAWMIAGILGSLLPLAARMPNPHLLLIPAIGSTALVGFILYHSWRGAREKRNLLNILRLVAGFAFIYILLLRPPLVWFEFGREWQNAHDRVERFHSQSIVSELRADQKAVFLNFNSWDLEFHGYYYRLVQGLTMPEAWWHLSRSSLQHRYHRTAADTLEMEVIDGGLANPSTEDGSPLFEGGDVRQLPGLHITVLDADPSGLTRVRFKFNRPLTDDAYRFMAWRGSSLESVDLPPVGGSIRVN